MPKLSFPSTHGDVKHTFASAGSSKEYLEIEKQANASGTDRPSSNYAIWSYLLSGTDIDSFEVKLERLICLLEDGYSIFKDNDLQILSNLISGSSALHISLLFELLQTMILSDAYQLKVLDMIKTSMLYSQVPEVRYAALELLSEVLEDASVRNILSEAKEFFESEEHDFVERYFQELYSLV